MRIYDIIEKKRDGLELLDSEIRFFIDGYTKGEIPDYQAAALVMAIYLRGMSDRETTVLTSAMAGSGDLLDLSVFGDLTVDKHSTGGVGDKTTLIVTPIVASLGCKVAKMSGRGLGHTGGTIDKLESIKGFRTELSPEEFISQVERVGISVISAGKALAPADKKLYALRDVTATVGSVPLIVSSIMSKKLAGGSKSIVLDVKTGSGAFCKSVENSRLLAEKMVTIGKASGRRVSAVITDMDIPLGTAVGNASEVKEAVAVLKGDDKNKDLIEVCVRLATEMVSNCLGYDLQSAEEQVRESIKNGNAYRKFVEWVSAQGGDVSSIEMENYGRAKYSREVLAPFDAYITKMDTEGIGTAAMLLGAGRKSKEDSIDFDAGVDIFAKTGKFVNKGDRIAVLWASNEELLDGAEEKYLQSLSFGTECPQKRPLIYDVVR